MKKLLTLAGAALLSCAAFAQTTFDYGDDDLLPPDNTQWATAAPWPKCNITYHFQNYTTDLPQADTRAAVQAAFATWSSVTLLTFTEVATAASADIVISWGTLVHGTCSTAFDGAHGSVAHAFYPGLTPLNGDLHFDEAEFWTLTGAGASVDLQTVALHEIGHTIGMQHSFVSGSVMSWLYGGVRRSLSADDIAGIRTIYPTPIQGPSSICTGTSTYTCNGPYAYYTWTATSGINILSGQGTRTITVSANPGTLSGTICFSSSVSGCSNCKLVGVGSPTPSNITFIRYGTSCEYQARATTVVGATAYQWSHNNFATFYTTTGPEDGGVYTPPTTVTISVRAVTLCGTSGIRTVTRSLTPPSGCMARLPGEEEGGQTVSEELTGFSVYPNPSDGIISIDVPEGSIGKTATVLDLSGRIVYTGIISQEHSSIDISAFESGIYFIRMDAENETYTQRIVIQH